MFTQKKYTEKTSQKIRCLQKRCETWLENMRSLIFT